jgi:hypothetical protein
MQCQCFKLFAPFLLLGRAPLQAGCTLSAVSVIHNFAAQPTLHLCCCRLSFSCPQERMHGIESKRRGRSVEENLAMFKEMQVGVTMLISCRLHV